VSSFLAHCSRGGTQIALRRRGVSLAGGTHASQTPGHPTVKSGEQRESGIGGENHELAHHCDPPTPMTPAYLPGDVATV
jgi:hypothetical protein